MGVVVEGLGHEPVMADEVLQWLDINSNGLYIDSTFGCGGHTLFLLKNSSCRVIGIDIDGIQMKHALKGFRGYEGRFLPIIGDYSDIDKFINKNVNGILFDFGYSSYQLDNPERGFSYRHDGPLDMRYRQKGVTAYELIENMDSDEISDILYHHGGERNSRRIAKKIKKEKPESTGELSLLIRRSVPRRRGHKHLGRIFQALRIAVNSEFRNIESGIRAAYNLLVPKGRLVVITYHSGEEKLVIEVSNDIGFRMLTKKPVKPAKEEIRRNFRSRSAHMRVFEK